MNIFKKVYTRTYQMIFRLVMPLMPFREPTILNSVNNISTILKIQNVNNVIIVTDSVINNLGLTKKLEEDLIKNGINFFVFDKTVPNPTISNVEDALIFYKNSNCQAIIAFGGGSAMDCAKALGARIARPNKSVVQMQGLMKVLKKIPLLIAIPTTAGTGSETTIAAVITNDKTKHKSSINDFNLIPTYAVLNESLTLNLPKKITSTTGMDALTHAVESYIGRSTTKQTRDASLRSTKLIFENIKKAYDNGNDAVARKNMLHASYLAGVAFTRSYVGYVHAVAHTLGGEYGVPHGFANAVILPIVLRHYGKAVYKKLKQLAVYCGVAFEDDSPQEATKKFIDKIEELNKYMQIPTKILGIKEQDIEKLSTYADKEANPLYPVPLLMDKNELKTLYYLIKE